MLNASNGLEDLSLLHVLLLLEFQISQDIPFED